MAKSKYNDWLTDEGLLQIEAWARDGLTEEQISHNMGVSLKTLYNWKTAHFPILQALKKGKAVVDIEVENALLKRALGCSYKEIKSEVLSDGTEKITTTIKEIVPDTTAQIFWLKNRKPQEWRDRKEQVISGEINSNPFKGLTTEELKKIIDK